MRPRTIINFTSIVSSVFILLFTYTGINKLLDRFHFQVVISRSPVIGSEANLISWMIPLIELLTVLLLFIPQTRIYGLWLSLLLMLSFTLYVFYMILFTPHLPCSCGGIIQKLSWRQHLFLNMILTGLSASTLFHEYKFFIKINRGSRKPVNE